jgi:DNA-directed RNA polymerase subunit beta'
MILGVYYLTTERKNLKGQGIIFANTNEVIRAYELGQVHPHTIIGITTANYPGKSFPRQGILVTTVGKVILNNILPSEMTYLNSASSVGHVSADDIVPHGEDARKVIDG